jgi:PAC2 family
VLPPEDLYQLHDAPDGWDLNGTTMLHSFSGFLDAGAASRLAVESLLSSLEHHPIATFDIDELIDFRARRPRLTFVEDHYSEVASSELLLHGLRDQSGTPFLLLTGPEPDYRWERFVAAVTGLVERFDVRLMVGMTGIPMAVPHTRPITLTTHATDKRLVTGANPWVGSIEVPGHVSGLLEFRLGEAGRDAMGFAAHVPHYLTEIPYPRAALALIQSVIGATNLALPIDDLAQVADKADAEIATQVAESGDNSEAIKALEKQYDAFVGARQAALGNLAGSSALPTADEIGAQVEEFLAGFDQPEDDK